MSGSNDNRGLVNEAGYVFRDRHPERTDVYRRFDEASAAARAELHCRRNLAYGRHPREVFDLFPAHRGSPLVVFVHGGYWQSLDKDRYSFIASALLRCGFSVALPNYPLAPEADVEGIVDSIRNCVPTIVQTLTEPPSFWIASGHSAGGHLAAALAMTAHPVTVPLAACVPISGIFDVEPLVATSLNASLGLDRERAAELSPIHWPTPPCELVALVGEEETEAFRNQSRDFAACWLDSGRNADLVLVKGRNHYTILEDLLEDGSTIARELVRIRSAFCREEKWPRSSIS